MNKHWYLIGQLAGARIFEQDGISPVLRLVRRFENPEGLHKTSDIVTDRQGRSDSGNMAGHNAVGDPNIPQAHVLEKFAKEIGTFLDQEAKRNAYDSLVIVAEPHVLGELKKGLGKPSSILLRQVVTKDYVHVPDTDMASHIAGVLCQREEVRYS